MSYIFAIFTETHKIPLTEIVCLRIVYAELGVLRQLLDLLGIMPGPFFVLRKSYYCRK